MSEQEKNMDLEETIKATLDEARRKRMAAKKHEEEEEGEEEESSKKMEEAKKWSEEEEESGKGKKKKMEEAKREEEEEEEEEEGEEEESSKKSKKKKKMEEEVNVDEETLAASSLHPAARAISDPKAISSKTAMMGQVMGTMAQMGKSDMVNFFNQVMGQFGPGKDYGVGDNSAKNSSTIDMKASHAVASSAPKTKYPMPKLNVKEDVDAMFVGEELTEEFKEKASTLFEAAVNARVISEVTRLEEEYESKLSQDIDVITEELSTKIDEYLNYIAENWMKENEVAIESTLRNELMEEFIDGLQNLFASHYVNVPESKIDVVEALADKVAALETSLNETIVENNELKNFVSQSTAEGIFEELSSDLALTQKEKFAALVEGIEFDGDVETFEKKLKIIKENYFKNESITPSNIETETFEGDVGQQKVSMDPSVNRYVQAINKTVKK